MTQVKKANKGNTAVKKSQKGKASADKAAIEKKWYQTAGEAVADASEYAGLGDPRNFSVTDDLVEPIFERSVGVATNIGISFGLQGIDSPLSLLGLLDSVNVANDLIKEINAEGLDQNFCKLPAPKELKDPNAIEFDNSNDACLERSTLYQKGKAVGESEGAVETIKNVLDFISELSRPADPTECINPYFDQFFNLIPLQFLINKQIRDLIKEALEGLTEKEIQQTVRNVQPCGAELETIITRKEIEFPDIFPLLTIPTIPTIPNINLYTILRRLIIELVCFSVCKALTPLIASSAQIILKGLNDFAKSELIEADTGAFRQLVANSLQKINLNEYIEASVINEAIKQNKVGGLVEAKILVLGKPQEGAILDRFGLWRPLDQSEEEEALGGVRNLIGNYFDAIFAFESETYKKQVFDPLNERFVFVDDVRELGTKEMVYMLLGEYNCLTIADLVSIGKRDEFKLLRLNTEERIVEFYRFIGVDFDAFSAISDLKSKSCPPEPCEELDAKVVDATQKRLAQLCKILNFKSGLPPLPINEILKALKLDQLFNQGIQQQFKQLKTEYLLYLGFPSLASFPTRNDVNPFLPKETVSFSDYELAESLVGSDTFDDATIKRNIDVFQNFMLRNQFDPILFWEYDGINLNKKLEGSKLDDFCGEDEAFEETFAFIYNNIFNLKTEDLSDSILANKKEQYKVGFEKRIKKEYERRAPGVGGLNPCCKFKNTSVVQKSLANGDDPDDVSTTYPDGVTTEEKNLINKMKAIYKEAEGLGSGTLGTIGLTLTLEEKCYICRRTQWFGKGNKSSLIAFLQGEGEEYDQFLNSINCKQFGYSSAAGAVSGHTKLDGSNIATIGKCPEKKKVEEATKEQAEEAAKDGEAKAFKWLDDWTFSTSNPPIRVEFWEYLSKKYVWLSPGSAFGATAGSGNWWGPISKSTIDYIKQKNEKVVSNPVLSNVKGETDNLRKRLLDSEKARDVSYGVKPWN